MPSVRPTRTTPGRSGEGAGGVDRGSLDSSCDQRPWGTSSSALTMGTGAVRSRVPPDGSMTASTASPRRASGLHTSSRNRASDEVKHAQEPVDAILEGT